MLTQYTLHVELKIYTYISQKSNFIFALWLWPFTMNSRTDLDPELVISPDYITIKRYVSRYKGSLHNFSPDTYFNVFFFVCGSFYKRIESMVMADEFREGGSRRFHSYM